MAGIHHPACNNASSARAALPLFWALGQVGQKGTLGLGLLSPALGRTFWQQSAVVGDGPAGLRRARGSQASARCQLPLICISTAPYSFLGAAGEALRSVCRERSVPGARGLVRARARSCRTTPSGDAEAAPAGGRMYLPCSLSGEMNESRREEDQFRSPF